MKKNNKLTNLVSTGPGQLTAEVRGPSGTVPCEIDHRGNGRYLVSFMPRMPGMYSIVIWRDITKFCSRAFSCCQFFWQSGASPCQKVFIIKIKSTMLRGFISLDVTTSGLSYKSLFGILQVSTTFVSGGRIFHYLARLSLALLAEGRFRPHHQWQLLLPLSQLQITRRLF